MSMKEVTVKTIKVSNIKELKKCIKHADNLGLRYCLDSYSREKNFLEVSIFQDTSLVNGEWITTGSEIKSLICESRKVSIDEILYGVSSDDKRKFRHKINTKKHLTKLKFDEVDFYNDIYQDGNYYDSSVKSMNVLTFDYNSFLSKETEKRYYIIVDEIEFYIVYDPDYDRE